MNAMVVSKVSWILGELYECYGYEEVFMNTRVGSKFQKYYESKVSWILWELHECYGWEQSFMNTRIRRKVSWIQWD